MTKILGPVFSDCDSKSDALSRRDVLRLSLAGFAGATAVESNPMAAHSDDAVKPKSPQSILTPASEFTEVVRGKPVPHTLRGEALVKARLTPETWRLEIVGDESAQVAKPCRLHDGSAIDLTTLINLGKTRGVMFLKAMQCLNIAQPLGQGLWEGVPLRNVLQMVGKLGNVRRIYYWGFHNDDPKQIFQSSLSYTQAMETPPSELPAFLAYRLNGEPLPLQRGGPVRMVVPWAHGFKSIKWLQRIVLTNDYKANDTYADEGNNDPESHLKTAAYIDSMPAQFVAGGSVVIRGTAIVGLSGLQRVESWLRPATGQPGDLAEDDPAWATAIWKVCPLDPPSADWETALPAGNSTKNIWGFDSVMGRPKHWPLPYSLVGWSLTIDGLTAGMYEFRARTVDSNGFAQPEPRPYQKSGRNLIQVRRFLVTA